MASKCVAVFLMCIVVVAAVQIRQAAADEYGSCYKSCDDSCKTEGNGVTFCEMKCDTDCVNKVNDQLLKDFKV